MTGAYHEPTSELSNETRLLHRAMRTLMEEVEAIDWYQQRIDASDDEDLKRLLTHNRDEEMEHAAMALEWLRRRMPPFDEALRTYLFTTGSLVELEEAESSDVDQDTDTAPSRTSDGGNLGIGALK